MKEHNRPRQASVSLALIVNGYSFTTASAAANEYANVNTYHWFFRQRVKGVSADRLNEVRGARFNKVYDRVLPIFTRILKGN